MAGKSHDPLTMDGHKPDAAHWKKDLGRPHPSWGIAVPAFRGQGHRPTCGAMVRFFFQKSTPRSYYVMHLRQLSMRGAAIWHMGKQPHLIAGFWKILQAIFQMRAMP